MFNLTTALDSVPWLEVIAYRKITSPICPHPIALVKNDPATLGCPVCGYGLSPDSEVDIVRAPTAELARKVKVSDIIGPEETAKVEAVIKEQVEQLRDQARILPANTPLPTGIVRKK